MSIVDLSFRYFPTKRGFNSKETAANISQEMVSHVSHVSIVHQYIID